MFPKFSFIKSQARLGLKGVWSKTIFKEFVLSLVAGETNVALCVYEFFFLLYLCLLNFVSSKGHTVNTELWGQSAITILGIHLLVSILRIIISSGMHIGLNKYYIELAEHPNDEPNSRLVTYISYYSSQLYMTIISQVKIALLTLLLFVPGLMASLKWSMAKYIIADEPTTEPGDALILSEQLMDGYKGKYLLFCISFLPSILLGIVTCGIGFIWIIPYIKASQAKFYESLKNPHWNKGETDELVTLTAEKFSYEDFLAEYKTKVEDKQNKR